MVWTGTAAERGERFQGEFYSYLTRISKEMLLGCPEASDAFPEQNVGLDHRPGHPMPF